MSTPNRRILIVGGGPAGSVTAFWLAKAGFEVVVLERSTAEPYGQGIDITGQAVEVARKMGILDDIKGRCTGEEGAAMVDDEGRSIATIGVNPSGGGTASVTQEHEIMRGDLTKIFANAAKALPNVTFRYGSTVSEIHHNEKSVTAVFTDDSEPEDFAAIIGADGLGSKVRQLIFDPSIIENCYHRTDTYVAFYSMPGDPTYDIPYAKLQHMNKGRALWLRPIDKEAQRASMYLMVTGDYPELAAVSRKGTQAEQQAVLEKLFKDFRGPMAPRAIQGMYETKDFYFTRIVQVKLDKWHNGRCALVGDAGYCPSPLTGQGTSCAIMGAYTLAGEMARSPDDLEAAFGAYHTKFGAFVKKAQRIPFWGYAPRMAEPWTDVGIWVLRSLFWCIAKSGVWKLFAVDNVGMKADVEPYEFKLE